MYPRQQLSRILATLQRGKSILLLGARQTGKTTLVESIPNDLAISLLEPQVRLFYETKPQELINQLVELKKKLGKIPLVFIDEIQKIPSLLDSIQYLIDKKVTQFILTGSSARKLRKSSEINLLPGRVIVYHLDPLTFSELPISYLTLDKLLYDGSLPAILDLNDSDTYDDLHSYTSVYVEEEIRKEALVRDVALFAKFLELAAKESGQIVNFSKLSQQIGVSHNAVKTYYQILEDCLIAFRVPPYTVSNHRVRLTRASRYIFFDLGVRRFCALEGKPLSLESQGQLLEQLIGLELFRFKHLHKDMMNIYFWRDNSGVEVDYVIEKNNQLIPIEVKLTKYPTLKDARHLITFLEEYTQASHAYIVCDCPMPSRISDTITAIPWGQLLDIFS